MARRNVRHDRNREKLIAAAIEILLGDGGMARFTSTHIVEAAGLHKPAFYAHFKNVEECLYAVAVHVAQTDMLHSMKLHAPAMEVMPPDSEKFRVAIETALRTSMEHKSLYMLLMLYRHAEGTLGEALRDIERQVYQHWTEYFWRLAVYLKVDPKYFREVQQLAEHIVGMTYFGGESLLRGRVTDVAAEAARLQRYNEAMIEHEMRRMLTEQAGGAQAKKR